jgi:hypothetical protein
MTTNYEIIEKFEDLLISEIEKIIINIISNNTQLNISAKSRAGAEISEYLEKKFLEVYKNISKFISNVETAPKGATKNPWDLRFKFNYKKNSEEIWVDFKALKTSSVDSNPDIGTPNKVVNIIENGFFYILYIYVFYDENEKGLQFQKINNSFLKLYFLKDIEKSFRRNPKNQLQVNASSKIEKRSREEFLKLLYLKIKESHTRQIEISQKALKSIEEDEKKIIKKNKELEEKFIKNCQ